MTKDRQEEQRTIKEGRVNDGENISSKLFRTKPSVNLLFYCSASDHLLFFPFLLLKFTNTCSRVCRHFSLRENLTSREKITCNDYRGFPVNNKRRR